MRNVERIGDWTPAELSAFVLQQIRQAPSSLPRSLHLEELGVADRLTIEDRLDLTAQAAASVLDKLRPIAVSNLAPSSVNGHFLKTVGGVAVWSA